MYETPTSPSRVRPSLISQLPVLVALLIIAGMLAIWKPWEATGASERTITVTGTAEITAEPDEYVFNPSYESKAADEQAALAASTAKTTEIVAKLKELGVPDRKIETNTSGYRNYYDDEGQTYYAYLTVTVDKKELAQKVQDYLLTTGPSGSVSPLANFSKAKRKQLEDQGRDQATKDARAKADQSAANLGFKVGKVKSVKDQVNEYFPAYDTPEAGAAGADAKVMSLPIQQGEDDLTYRVVVTYYVR